MVFIQRRGPFNGSLTFAPETPIALNYLQIGIEHPQTIPISEFEEDSYPFIFSINNGERYLITERDVLEFSDLSLSTFTIVFLKPENPYLIVNVAYEEAN